MDPWSLRLANALVGNHRDAAVLEAALVGPELRFEDERTVAVAGAGFEVVVDGRIAGVMPVQVGRGSTLRLGARSRGSRAYIAVGGGIDVPTVLGSRATHVLSRMGGFGGRALLAGDRLPLGLPGRSEARRLQAPSAALAGLELVRGVTPGGIAIIRVLPGPQLERFVGQAMDVLQSAPYRVGKDSNRMGFRLEGPPLRHAITVEMISDATPLGVLQVPAGGQPLLLMADRQTTGGYPKLATVITADIGLAGQLGPGDYIRFVECSETDALAELARMERALRPLEDGL
jgi:antagonist of KipI